MLVNIEGNVGQTSAASGWYQNSRVASPQKKEKDAPQPKADNTVKVSISQEGIESYRKQTCEKGISGRIVVKGKKESVISGPDRVFRKMADRADTREMIEGEFKRLRTEGGKGLSTNASKKPQGADGDATKTARQKMKRLAREWRDAYKTSGSKESGMEKVLSMLNSMFGISKKVC